ncbi:hypothetical protein CDLVIII_5657 [Clostridium sp. DL-VIII]|nr:hypothetical protein CDLVIII_5657 [Clostridium sp. DL-VIII]
MDKTTHEMRLMHWTSIISECRSSGKGVRSWCNENNINEKQFYYWQRRVRGQVFKTLKNTESQKQINFVQLPVPIESSITTPSFKSDIVIHVGNNVLEISNTVSENLLSMVLKVMSNVK